MAQFDLKRAYVRFRDGSGTPKTLDLNIGEGTVTYDERRNMEYVRNRGVLDTVREGDEEPMDVRLDLKWEFLTSNTTTNPTPEDALKNEGGAADWVSSDTDACNPYAVDIQIWYDPNCATEDIEDIILPDFRYESISHDAAAGTIAVSGRCNATKATSTRSSQT